MSCRCHEPTIKWCADHGQPLRLNPGERVLKQDHLDTLVACLDPIEAVHMAELIRKAARAR